MDSNARTSSRSRAGDLVVRLHSAGPGVSVDLKGRRDPLMSRAFSRVGASKRLRAPSDQSPVERNHFGARRVRERRNMGVGPESWEPALQAGHSAKLRRDRRRFRQKHDACIRKESVEYEPSRGRRERVCGPRRGHGQKARNSDLSQPRERYLLRLVSIPPSHGFLSAGGLAARARAKP